MFGLSVGKILVVLVAVVAVFAATRMLRRIGGASSEKGKSQQAETNGTSQDLVPCPKCGVFLPSSDAEHACGKG